MKLFNETKKIYISTVFILILFFKFQTKKTIKIFQTIQGYLMKKIQNQLNVIGLKIQQMNVNYNLIATQLLSCSQL